MSSCPETRSAEGFPITECTCPVIVAWRFVCFVKSKTEDWTIENDPVKYGLNELTWGVVLNSQIFSDRSVFIEFNKYKGIHLFSYFMRPWGLVEIDSGSFEPKYGTWSSFQLAIIAHHFRSRATILPQAQRYSSFGEYSVLVRTTFDSRHVETNWCCWKETRKRDLLKVKNCSIEYSEEHRGSLQHQGARACSDPSRPPSW